MMRATQLHEVPVKIDDYFEGYPEVNQDIKFRLDRDFVRSYADETPEFGFGGLGYVVYLTRYSRQVPGQDRNERWYETIARVVNGTFSLRKRHMVENKIEYDEKKERHLAEGMYDAFFHMRCLPPGRGLWAMGSKLTEEKGVYMALQNCAFTSTAPKEDNTLDYAFMMDASMLGVGVGFNTDGKDVLVQDPDAVEYKYVIPDTREGWVNSLRLLLHAYFTGDMRPKFDYSLIRKKGEPIKTFGGVSSGPDPLIKLHEEVDKLLWEKRGERLGERGVVDIMNMIGRAVVSGNVRRSAQLALSPTGSEEFLSLKDYSENPERAEYGWASNNSISALLGQDYEDAIKKTQINGEPGYIWMDNVWLYGRMGEKDYSDMGAEGFNPCVEQPLWDRECCTLAEVMLNNTDERGYVNEAVFYAHLYAISVTLGASHWKRTREVMFKNRRIGVSVTGVSQYLNKYGIGTLKRELNTNYNMVQGWNEAETETLQIPRSIRTTTVKPSGTVSLLAGATPGMHWASDRRYIRRVTFPDNDPVVPLLREAGYKVEEYVYSDNSLVAEFYIDLGDEIRTENEVNIFEQVRMAEFMQRFWSDNGVSVTITFDPETEGKHIADIIRYAQYNLKALSLLPKTEQGAFEQMPYEVIDEETFTKLSETVDPEALLTMQMKGREAAGDQYCDSDGCIIL
jgi:adenosylcobalamin-dependent ribonucleoside-triphosphate reductase